MTTPALTLRPRGSAAARKSGKGIPALPADPEAVAPLIYMPGIGGKKPNTLRGYAPSITAKHRSAKYDSPRHDKVATFS